MNVVFVSGKAQNGKDTVAGYLMTAIKSSGKNAIIFHYADFLKYIAKTYFGWDGKKDEKGRSLLQRLGTGVFRGNRPECWVNMAKEFILGLGDTVEYVIIADCRFKNEISWADGIDQIKGTTVRVERPNFDNGLTEKQKKHISETDLDEYNFDYRVVNDGTIDELKRAVLTLFNYIEGDL